MYCILNLLITVGRLFSAGTLAVTLANLDGEESYDASMLGHAEEVVEERICDDELLLIKGCVYTCVTAVADPYFFHFGLPLEYSTGI